MSLSEIAQLVQSAMERNRLDPQSVGAQLPGGTPALQAYLGGRRWPEGDGVGALAAAIGEEPRVVERAVQRQSRSLEGSVYGPPTPTRLRAEAELLVRHLPVLLAARDSIVADPLLAACAPSQARLSLAYLGRAQLSLHHLLDCWVVGELRAPCAVCDAVGYVCEAWGSPLSGIRGAKGVCPSCQGYCGLNPTGVPGFTLTATRVWRAAHQWAAAQREPWIDRGEGAPWPEGALPLLDVVQRVLLIGESERV